MTNKQIILASYPDGVPEPGNFGLIETDIPEPGIRCTSTTGPYIAITGGVSFVTVFYD